MKYSTEEVKALRKKRCCQDERDEQIERESKSWAAEIMVGVAEVFFIACLFKHSGAWKGFLSVILAGAAALFIHKYGFDREKTYLAAGLLFAAGALAFGLWFLFS